MDIGHRHPISSADAFLLALFGNPTDKRDFYNLLMPISPARSAAFDILLRVEQTEAYASELLHSERLAKLSPADHGLATELVMGVLRWRSVLDAQLASHIAPPLAKLDHEVLTALRLGAYQLLFLDRIPRHAATNESVELVKRARKKSAAGMVNAVLRKIGDDAFRAAPTSAHPQWLVERWRRNYGAEKADMICEHDQAPPRTAIHTNTPDAVRELEHDGVQLTPGALLTKCFIVHSGDVSQTRSFREHRLPIQDEASQLVALLISDGENILDCCAAPGGKTRIMAERNSHAKVVAMELHPHRAALIKKLVHAPNVRIVSADVRTMPLSQKFDRILVDAPCSGTGTLARNPEIKWRLKEQDLLRLRTYQLEILKAAMKYLTWNGRIVYSTCSLEPEENQHVIQQALTSETNFRICDCRDDLQMLRDSGELAWQDIDSLVSGPFLRTIPGVHPCDGFFAAVLQKK